MFTYLFIYPSYIFPGRSHWDYKQSLFPGSPGQDGHNKILQKHTDTKHIINSQYKTISINPQIN